MIPIPPLYGEVGGRRPPGGVRAAMTVMGLGPHPTPLRGATLRVKGRDELTSEVLYVIRNSFAASSSAASSGFFATTGFKPIARSGAATSSDNAA
jgi:hypothetical protein